MSSNQFEGMEVETIDLLSKSSSDLTKNTQISPIPAVCKSNDSESSSQHAKNRRKKKPKKVAPTVATNYADPLIDYSSPSTPVNTLLSTVSASDSKFDSDGCETIDKIALMVSNITQSALPLNLTLPPAPIHPQPSSVVNDVENKLEELFSETKTDPPPPSVEIETPVEVPQKVEVPKVKKPRKKPDGKRPQKKSSANDAKSKGGKGDKSSKFKSSDKNDVKKPKAKESNGRSRVKIDTAPFLQIQSDGSFQIVNQTANGDEDAEKSNSKSKKPANEKHKQIRGLHVSTLSKKYDAEQRDTSWVCVFCKLEPHKFKLGDLFGPYIISKTSKEYELCLEDPANDIFRQGNRNKFAPISPPITSPTPPAKKKRKLTSPLPVTSQEPNPEMIFNGMTKIDDDHYEIWFHEDCLVWSPGTYIIGSKINELEAAVWQSTRHQCSMCSKNGAMMACLHRGCKKEAHYVCGRKAWKLCEDFKTFCELHST